MIAIRTLTTREEFEEAVQLQRTIWGFAEIELLPVRLFVVANKVGGQVFGGFDEERMIAFLLAIPGIKPGGKAYLHSHMMGVLQEYRDMGIGRMLKHRQRDEALQTGVGLVEWTFDPLELKNAFFNIERLGAVVRRYVLNQYGTTSSHLHGGLPTDRCVAEWYVASRRVEQVLAGEKPELRVESRIPVPWDIARWRTEEPVRAREEQHRISEQFLACFRDRLAVIGFERTETTGTYLLGPWESE